MLIKSPNSVNVYRPSSFADTILEDGEISEGEWHANLILIHFIHYRFRERVTTHLRMQNQ